MTKSKENRKENEIGVQFGPRRMPGEDFILLLICNYHLGILWYPRAKHTLPHFLPIVHTGDMTF